MRARRLPSRIGSVLAACAMACGPSAGSAQPLETQGPPPADTSLSCPPPTVPSTSNALTRSLVTEWAVLKQDWCKLLKWDDTWPRLQYFLVDVFTGPGVHPTAGIVVPNGGGAGGLALNVDWNTHFLGQERFVSSIEGRATENDFWEVGGKLQALFAGYSERGKSPQATLFASHLDLPKLPYWGLGNDSLQRNRQLYGLQDTAVSAALDWPFPHGFALGGELAGLWYVPEVSSGFGSVYDDTTAPGLHTTTTYVRPRVSLSWSFPDRGVLSGFSTNAVVTYAFHGAVSGGDFSFNRVEGRWKIGYGFDPIIGSVRFSARFLVSDPLARNSVPFYLQPTLGGADINDENNLRGYSNYRFRDRSLVAYEASYERQIWDPIGIRIFGQFGKVGGDLSDLGFNSLKSSAGFSLTFRLGGAAVAELSFGWSKPSGLHVYGSGNTNNLGGLTAGLRGVF